MIPTELTALRNATLHDGRVVDLHIAGGFIDRVSTAGTTASSPGVLDVEGQLVIPGLVEAHTHLDKALTGHLVDNVTGDLRGAMDAFFEVGQQGRLATSDCIARVNAALWLLIERGVTAVRTHVDVGVGTSFDHVAAVLEGAAAFRDLIDIQLVALMYAPLTGDEGAENRRRLRAALEHGVGLIGAATQLEPDPIGAIEVLLDAAADAGVPIDIHLDETLDPTVLHLEHLARRVLEREHPLPITASHCVSLGVQPLGRQQEVARLVAEAGISIVALPESNLYLQGRDVAVATPRGITPITLLRDHGVVVCGGSDNIRDPFNPLGCGDPLATASSLVVAGHQRPDDAIAMVTRDARAALGLPPVNLAAGDPADLVVLGAPELVGVLGGDNLSRTTIRRGHVLSRVEFSVQRFRDAAGD